MTHQIKGSNLAGLLEVCMPAEHALSCRNPGTLAWYAKFDHPLEQQGRRDDRPAVVPGVRLCYGLFLLGRLGTGFLFCAFTLICFPFRGHVLRDSFYLLEASSNMCSAMWVARTPVADFAEIRKRTSQHALCMVL